MTAKTRLLKLLASRNNSQRSAARFKASCQRSPAFSPRSGSRSRNASSQPCAIIQSRMAMASALFALEWEMKIRDTATTLDHSTAACNSRIKIVNQLGKRGRLCSVPSLVAAIASNNETAPECGGHRAIAVRAVVARHIAQERHPHVPVGVDQAGHDDEAAEPLNGLATLNHAAALAVQVR